MCVCGEGAWVPLAACKPQPAHRMPSSNAPALLTPACPSDALFLAPQSFYENAAADRELYSRSFMYRLLFYPHVMIEKVVHLANDRPFPAQPGLLTDDQVRLEDQILRSVLPIVAMSMGFEAHYDARARHHRTRDDVDSLMRHFEVVMQDHGRTHHFRFLFLAMLYREPELQRLVAMIEPADNFRRIMSLVGALVGRVDTLDTIFNQVTPENKTNVLIPAVTAVSALFMMDLRVHDAASTGASAVAAGAADERTVSGARRAIEAAVKTTAGLGAAASGSSDDDDDEDDGAW